MSLEQEKHSLQEHINILESKIYSLVKEKDIAQKKYELLQDGSIKKETALLFYMFFLIVGISVGLLLK